jgi:flagellar motor switch protein FliN
MSEPPKFLDSSLREKMFDELRHFWDVPAKISTQVDARVMKVRDILDLKPGSLIALPKQAGEIVDVLINGYLIAFGELMVLEASRGIRLTGFNPGKQANSL